MGEIAKPIKYRRITHFLCCTSPWIGFYLILVFHIIGIILTIAVVIVVPILINVYYNHKYGKPIKGEPNQMICPICLIVFDKELKICPSCGKIL